MADADSNTASSGTLTGSLSTAPQQQSQTQPDSTEQTQPSTELAPEASEQQQQQQSIQSQQTQTQNSSNPNPTDSTSNAVDASLDADIEADITQQPSAAADGGPDPMSLDGPADNLPHHAQNPETSMNNHQPPPADASSALEQTQAAAAAAQDPTSADGALYISPRLPAKKDTSLRHFLSKMDSTYTPLIPDAVTAYYLTLSGLPPPPETPLPLARLLALATQKFIADIAADAYQYSRIRSTNTTSNNPLTGLGGAAGFGAGLGGGNVGGGGGGEDGGAGGQKKGPKDGAKAAPIGGPRPGFGGGGAGGAGGSGGGGVAGQARTVLTMEDLGMAVGEYGVNVRRGEFYR